MYPPRPAASSSDPVGADVVEEEPMVPADEDEGPADELAMLEDVAVDMFLDMEELAAPLLEPPEGPGPIGGGAAPGPAPAAAEVAPPGAGEGALVAADVPPPPAPVGAAPRAYAAVSFYVRGGSISYYASKSCFEAVCGNRAHGRCVLTRTCNGKGGGKGGGLVGGRPVGFLAAWLAQGDDAPDKATHWSEENMKRPQGERAAMRDQISEMPSGRLLLDFERPLEAGEQAEPESLRGLLPRGMPP